MLSAFMRHAKELRLHLCAYFEPVNEGAIAVQEANTILTPAGEVFSIFKLHQGNSLLNATSHDGIDIVASRAKDDSIIVTLVNKSFQELKVIVVVPGNLTHAQCTFLHAKTFLPRSKFERKKRRITLHKGKALISVPQLSIASMRII